MERNLSREAHLWYTITSPETMDRARDHLQAAVNIMIPQAQAHPFIADYAPVPYWGGRMEDLLRTFANARALLVQGEYGEMIGWGGALMNIPRGLREGNMNWMSTGVDDLMGQLNLAVGVCGRFNDALTQSQRLKDDEYKTGALDWRICVPRDVSIPGDNIARFYESAVYPVRPFEIPEYAPDKSITCKTGEIVPWTGVWVPADGMGKAALAFARKGIQIMQPAYPVISEDEETGWQEFDIVECVWHPVKPTGRMVPLPPTEQEPDTGDAASLRCPANQPCPQAGWWSTPAKADSRRLFAAGEVMPEFGSDYGATIWQWDLDQG
ncbi:hypothetical protein OPU71_18030 [Niveibacterium sp. 24ML]|uniref:hypothetical protein n=1 Tax=Niveibacterium sp. 24ML TaxID=2985512 RepID=UPI00226DB2DB|nr:hypothetical protein [Niveibacterium sp. 24ML]MCX9158027.1 hypothetical protein [Niveibacterium sp. 24ML]